LPYVLIGLSDLDIQRKDTFVVNEETFVVETLDIKRDIRIAAQVDYVGAPANA
jgi:hypothetical protein